MKKVITQLSTTLPKKSVATLDDIDRLVGTTATTVESYIGPVRKSVAARYPGLFSVLGTIGAATTFLGIEQILLSSTVLERHPFLIFCIGIVILLLTGSLYKKLS